MLDPQRLSRAARRVTAASRVPAKPELRDDAVARVDAVALAAGAAFRLRVARFDPLRRVVISKQGGGTRTLLVPTRVDRIAARSFLDVVGPELSSRFGVGLNGVHEKVLAVAKLVADADAVVRTDLRESFASVAHGDVLAALGVLIDDDDVLDVAAALLARAGGGRGLAVGCPASPLLHELAMLELDVEIRHRFGGLVRYVDDIVVPAGAGAVEEIGDVYLRRGFRLNTAKTVAVAVDEGVAFLGHIVVRHGERVAIEADPRRIEAFRTRELERRALEDEPTNCISTEVIARNRRQREEGLRAFYRLVAPPSLVAIEA